MKPKDMRDLTLRGMNVFMSGLKDDVIKWKAAIMLFEADIDKPWRGGDKTLRECYVEAQERERDCKFAVQWLQDMKFDQ